MSASRPRLEAMEQGLAVRHVGTLLGVPCFVSAVELGSRSGLIGLINLDVKCPGARSAGNPNPNGNGEPWIGRTYGAMAPVLDPTGLPPEVEMIHQNFWSSAWCPLRVASARTLVPSGKMTGELTSDTSG